MSDFDLSVRFFLQLAAILGTCRAVGAPARSVGQHECPRPHGADHPEHWLRAGHHHADLFSIVVMMALVTTFMATPLFELVHGRKGRLAGLVGPVRFGSLGSPRH